MDVCVPRCVHITCSTAVSQHESSWEQDWPAFVQRRLKCCQESLNYHRLREQAASCWQAGETEETKLLCYLGADFGQYRHFCWPGQPSETTGRCLKACKPNPFLADLSPSWYIHWSRHLVFVPSLHWLTTVRPWYNPLVSTLCSVLCVPLLNSPWLHAIEYPYYKKHSKAIIPYQLRWNSTAWVFESRLGPSFVVEKILSGNLLQL